MLRHRRMRKSTKSCFFMFKSLSGDRLLLAQLLLLTGAGTCARSRKEIMILFSSISHKRLDKLKTPIDFDAFAGRGELQTRFSSQRLSERCYSDIFMLFCFSGK